MFYVLLSPTFKSGSDKKVFTYRVQKYIFQYTFHDVQTHTCMRRGRKTHTSLRTMMIGEAKFPQSNSSQCKCTTLFFYDDDDAQKESTML